jgi:hypothetical protein
MPLLGDALPRILPFIILQNLIANPNTLITYVYARPGYQLLHLGLRFTAERAPQFAPSLNFPGDLSKAP